MNQRDMPATRCRKCGHRFDAASPVEGEGRATEGSISLCIECAEISVFNADLSLRGLDEGEWDAIPEDKRAEILRACRVIRRCNRERALQNLTKKSKWN